MQLFLQAFFLFVLNFFDAVLTVYWVHNGFATEGNHLMAELLDIGYAPFLLVKILIGAIAAAVLWHWRSLPVARVGLALTLLIYVSLMGVHLVTGLSAFGFISDRAIHDFVSSHLAFLAFSC